MRRAGWAACLLATVVLPGCGPSATPEQQSANQAVVEELAAEVASSSGGGVTLARATYVDDASSQAEVSLSFECDGCDAPALQDAALAAVWRSRVTPLLAISIQIQGAPGPRLQLATWSVLREEEELTERYGERPVPSRPEDQD